MDGSKALSSFFFLLFSIAHWELYPKFLSIEPLDVALGSVCNVDIKLLQICTSFIRLKPIKVKLVFIFDITNKTFLYLWTKA